MRYLICALVSAMCFLGCHTGSKPMQVPETHIEPPDPQLYTDLVDIPGWDAKQNAEAIYSPEEVSLVFSVFLDEWLASFGGNEEEIREYFNAVELHWQTEVFKSKLIADHPRLWGLTVIYDNPVNKKVYVYVYDKSGNISSRLGNTSLVHELIHVALYATIGSTVPDHFGNRSKFTPKLERYKNRINNRF